MLVIAETGKEAAAANFLLDTFTELQRAQSKFPDSVLCVSALMEEVGELAEAMLKRRAGGKFPYLPKYEKLPSGVHHILNVAGISAEVYDDVRRETAREFTDADVRAEAIQVAVMAMRVALEGDRSFDMASYSEPQEEQFKVQCPVCHEPNCNDIYHRPPKR